MTRKSRIRLASGLVCVVWFAQACWVANAASPAADGAGRLKPISQSDWTVERARHLLFRGGFGGSVEDVQALYKLGPVEAVNRLVDFGRQPALELPAPDASQLPELAKPPANATPEERQRLNNRLRRDDQERMAELRAWWVRRMIESPRPLEEKLTLFWHGLLTSGYQTVRSSFAMYQQNELLRRHAAGNYGALLHGIVHDPAMLRYLDNSSNVRGRPNENLGRELLELFSLGEGNYSEADIKEGARALTGFNYDRQTWRFRFAAFSHDTGEKTVFGQTGNWDGDKLVDLVLQQPAAARYITRKLFVFFVHDEPAEPIVDELARIFRENDYEISPVLKAIFLSKEFYSERTIGKHVKSPAELVASTIRVLPVSNSEYQPLVASMRAMGQDLFEPPNVKGWDGNHAWLNSNSLFVRQNFAVGLINGGLGRSIAERGREVFEGKRGAAGRGIDLVAVCRDNGMQKPEEIVAFFSRTLFALPLDASERAELLSVLGELPPATDWATHEAKINVKLRKLVTLMLSMPQYQLS